MIALKTFKYLIWDYCLTKLFEGFQKNFITYHINVINLSNIERGMYFTSIKLKTSKCTFINCIVTDIFKNKNDNYVISFNWTAIRGAIDLIKNTNIRYSNPYSISSDNIYDIEFNR